MSRYDSIYNSASESFLTEDESHRLPKINKITFADFVQIVKSYRMGLDKEACGAQDDLECDFNPNDYKDFDKVKTLEGLLQVMDSFGYDMGDVLGEFLSIFVSDFY